MVVGGCPHDSVISADFEEHRCGWDGRVARKDVSRILKTTPPMKRVFKGQADELESPQVIDVMEMS